MCAAQGDHDIVSREWRQWVPLQSARVEPIRGFICPVCENVSCQTREHWDRHLADPLHRYNYYCYTFKTKREHKVQNRHEVEISTRCETNEVIINSRDGTVKSTISSDQPNLVYEFEVKNTSNFRQGVTLCDVYLLHSYPIFEIHEDDNFTRTRRRIYLYPNASCTMRIIFINTGIGSYGVPIAFNFCKIESTKSSQVLRRNKVFDIVRVMVIDVVGPDHLASKPTHESPFTGEDWDDVTAILYAVSEHGRPTRRNNAYPVTYERRIMFENWLNPWQGISAESLQELNCITTVIMSGYIALKDYYDVFFHTMLYLEEFDATSQINNYNMTNAQMRLTGIAGQVELQIPGLAEKRPPLVRGDLIYVRIRHQNGPREYLAYQGVITQVFESSIFMSQFGSEFYERFGNETHSYDIHFSFSRFPVTAMHRAIDLAIKQGLLDVLFPEAQDPQPALLEISADHLEFYNPDIELNPEQMSAIVNILEGTHRPAPYVIYGPPGTGKTATVAEAILQIRAYFPNSRILVCAPSNSACDVVAQKLIGHCFEGELLRLYSSSREWDTVPENIRSIANREEARFFFPRLETIASYDIVVCTLITASRLVAHPEKDWYPRFTHVFIDECGQAQETEALSAISGILDQTNSEHIGGQLVIAGDPQQLGPVCHSYRAKKARGPEFVVAHNLNELDDCLGLGVSLLERLMETNTLYKKDENGFYNNQYITKLLNNYRSHPRILELPNRMFYANELVSSCGNEVLNDPILGYPLLGNFRNGNRNGAPVIFHGIQGQELAEGESPSLFNCFEIDQVMAYVERLLNSHMVRQDDIGVISPYIRQAFKINKRLQEKGWRRIEVGSVESFQGREKRVVIVSLVRSNKNMVDVDHSYKLGFVSSPRRFNVALTRAKSLLIVIGSPFALGNDPCWLELIRFCREMRSYTGCPFQIRDNRWKLSVSKKMDKLIPDD